MTDAERAQRERLREGAGGITSYATDADTTVVAFAVGGTLFAGGLISGRVRRLDVQGPVFDPRPDPTARRIAYVCGRQLRIGELDGRSRPLAGGERDAASPTTVTRCRGGAPSSSPPRRWAGSAVTGGVPTAPRSRRAASTTRPVAEWVIADPADPERARTNDPLSGGRDGQRHGHPARARARRLARRRRLGPAIASRTSRRSTGPTPASLMLVQSRDQRSTMLLRVDPATGETTVLADEYDARRGSTSCPVSRRSCRTAGS